MTDRWRRLSSSQRHMALHMGTTAPSAAAGIAGPHVIMGEWLAGLATVPNF